MLIELSPVAGVAQVGRILAIAQYSGQQSLNSYQGALLCYDYWNGTEQSMIHLMKGTVPTDFSGLSATGNDADILLTWSPRLGHFAPSVLSTNPAVINTTYVAASASGTATWFWWRQRPTYGGTFLWNSLFGTVGSVSSGADLEIPSTTIVAGLLYKMSNFRLSFPTSWNY